MKDYYISIKTPIGKLMKIVDKALKQLNRMDALDIVNNASKVKQLGDLLLQIERRNWQNATFTDYERYSSEELLAELALAKKSVKSLPENTDETLPRRTLDYIEDSNNEDFDKMKASKEENGSSSH